MSQLLPDDQVCEAYRRVRESVLALLTQTPESAASTVVPACPEWTVQQTASHLVGVPEDVLARRMEGVTTDAWTDAQVRRHSGESLGELRAALEATVVPFDAVLPTIQAPASSQLVMDAVTHEIDLREALGLEYEKSSLPLSVAKAWLLDLIDRRDSSALPAIDGSGCSDFDLVRSLTGRRSATQMDDLGLPGDQIVAALEGTPLKPPASPSV